MNEGRSSDASSPLGAVTFEIHLFWASWAAPSLPAPLTARELQGVLPSDVLVIVHDVSVNEPSLGRTSQAYFPDVLPTWRIVTVRNSKVIGERLLAGAHPKFEIREALEVLRADKHG